MIVSKELILEKGVTSTVDINQPRSVANQAIGRLK